MHVSQGEIQLDKIELVKEKTKSPDFPVFLQHVTVSAPETYGSLLLPVSWIQIHWIWIRNEYFGPISIWMHGYLSIFKNKKCCKKLRRKNISCEKDLFFFNNKIMELEEIFSELGLWMVNFVFNLTPFASYLSYFHLRGSGCGSVFGIRILIHQVPEC